MISHLEYAIAGMLFTVFVVVLAVCTSVIARLVWMMGRIFLTELQTRRAMKIFRKHQIAHAIHKSFSALHEGRNWHEDGPHR